MTERGSAQLRRAASSLVIGQSHLHWSGDALEIGVDEHGAPVPRRVRGTIRLIPSALSDRSFSLDGEGRHEWTPFAPCSRVEVRFSHPPLRWSGVGYFDANRGSEPLEAAFSDWAWSRMSVPGGSIVLYDVNALEAPSKTLALRFATTGEVDEIEFPPPSVLPTTRWKVARRTRADSGTNTRIIKTLEDAPFYSRTLLESCVLGARGPAIHESLDLRRFSSRWVQCLLPFRMPRITF